MTTTEGPGQRRRQSIYVDTFAHKNPVPAACKIGNLVYSGGIHGLDPETLTVPPSLEDQCVLMFRHVKATIETAGGSTADIIKMTLWMNDRTLRPIVNREWLAMFPDASSRPTRHAMKAQLEGGMQIQCDFIAVLDSGR